MTNPNSFQNIWKLRDIIYIILIILGSLGYAMIISRFLPVDKSIKLLIVEIITTTAMIVPIIIILKNRGVAFSQYFTFKLTFKTIFLGLLGALIVIFIGGALAQFISHFIGLDNPQKDLVNFFSDNMILNILIFKIMIGIVIPFAEELVFRGVLFNYLKQSFGLWFSIIVSSFAFAIVHAHIVIIPFAFVAGIVCAYMYHRTNNFAVPVFIHVAINSLMVNILLLEIVP